MGNLKRRQYMSWYRLLLIAIIGTLVFNFYPDRNLYYKSQKYERQFYWFYKL